MEIKQISLENIEEIKVIISEAFSEEPWNDDWQDEQQFNCYISDLIDNKNSLALGLYRADELIGVCLGRIKHWYSGNEYWIDDLAIMPKAQGKGCGSRFIALIEDFIRQKNIKGIVLFTQRDASAFDFYKKNNFEEKTERVIFEKRL